MALLFAHVLAVRQSKQCCRESWHRWTWRKNSFSSNVLGSCRPWHDVVACHCDRMPGGLSTGCLVKGTWYYGNDCYRNISVDGMVGTCLLIQERAVWLAAEDTGLELFLSSHYVTVLITSKAPGKSLAPPFCSWVSSGCQPWYFKLRLKPRLCLCFCAKVAFLKWARLLTSEREHSPT